MFRNKHQNMRIGWISPTVGCFGAVREMVEVSNVLIKRGHQVSIYHPEGGDCKWLQCLADCRSLPRLQEDHLDAVIGIVDWQSKLYEDLVSADAKIKAICLLGFSPSVDMAASLRGENKHPTEAEAIIRDAILRKFLLLADSSWQVDWVRKYVGYAAGPAFGGINLKMFCPPPHLRRNPKPKIIYSGDPRERKGTDTVEKAIEIIKSNIDVDTDFYWGKKFDQKELVRFIQQGDIFLDAHRRAGWCNPVAEAIACGVVPVCTRIGANQDFAMDGETALLVPLDDAEAMAEKTIRLIKDEDMRARLRENGLKHIQNFAYELVVPNLEKALERKVHA